MLESTAYTRLKDQGLCDRGIVPYYLGSMRKFDPSLCQPHLKMLLDNEYPPSAIFLEYIPKLEMLHLQHYTQQRADKFAEGIREIHKALVRHGDPKPRNMMVVTDDPERVVWIDFDRAKTYDGDQITSEQKALLDEEEETVVGFNECLVSAPVSSNYIFLTPIPSDPTTRKESSMKRICFTVLDSVLSFLRFNASIRH